MGARKRAMRRVKLSRPQKVIWGYIHEKERELNLSTVVPMGVIDTLISFYPWVIGFGMHNPAHFSVSEHGTVLKGINSKSCSGFMVYAHLAEQDVNGYNAGIHTWCLQSISDRSGACYQSIGVTVKRPLPSLCDTKTSHWPNESTANKEDSYYSGYSKQWKKNQIMSVRLNCNDWTATYYKGEELQKVDKLKPDKHYFLAMSCCASKDLVQVKSVEFPGEKTHFMHI